MSDYHCIVAGLPDISLDDAKLSFRLSDFKTEIYPLLTTEDQKLIDLFYLGWDNKNLLALLKDKNAVLTKTGCYTAERLREIIASALDGDKRIPGVPDYLYDFLTIYAESNVEEKRLTEDVLSAYYFSYAMQSKNLFLARWFEFNLNVNNILVALTARQYKLSVSDYVVGDTEVCQALTTSNARDFGLSATVDYFETVQHISDVDDLVEREHKLDRLKWTWLEEAAVFNYFSVEQLYLFLQKLEIAERWTMLDNEKGVEVFEEIVKTLKKDIRIPEEFNV